MKHIIIVIATLVLFGGISFSAAIQDSYSYSFTGLQEGSSVSIPGGQFRVASITVTGSSVNLFGNPTCIYNVREVQVTTPNDARTIAVDGSASMKYFTHANGQTKLLQVHVDDIQATSQNAAPNCNAWVNKRVDFTITVDSLFVCTDPDANAASPSTQASTVTQDRYYATKSPLVANTLHASQAAPAVSADACVSNSQVTEFSCGANGAVQSSIVNCAEGFACQNGACVAQAAPNSCSDSDNGADTATAGTTSGIHNGVAYSHSDSCVDADTVREYQCFGANDDSSNRNCAAGLLCQNGACVDPNARITCTDSDNGRDEDERGTTRRLNQNGVEVESHTDVCQDDNTVREYFCRNDAIDSEDLNCDSDQACSSGRCTDSNLVDDSINGLYSSEYCAGRRVGLRDSLFYNNYEFQLSRIYEDSVRDCTVAELEVYKNGERVSTIFGCPSQNPYKRSNQNDNIEAYVCGVDTVDDVAYLDVSVLKDNLDLEFLCRDSDGGRDSDERGTSVVATYDQDTGELLETHAAQDVCVDSKVREFYCSNDELRMTQLSCGSRETCQNGRCVTADEMYCSDSDGDDLTVKGTAESGYMRNGQRVVLDRANDVCQDGQVRELVCNGVSPGSKMESCPAGSICSDGACVQTTQTVELQLKKGWNAFSVPLSDAHVRSTTCDDFSVSKMWAYSSSYYHPSKYIPGIGMWFYAANNCKVTFEGNPYSFSQSVLSKGWNVVGFDSSSRPADAVFQECSFSGNVWKYDALNQKYSKVDTVEKGSAYFVKVDSPCEIKG